VASTKNRFQLRWPLSKIEKPASNKFGRFFPKGISCADPFWGWLQQKINAALCAVIFYFCLLLKQAWQRHKIKNAPKGALIFCWRRVRFLQISR